MPKIKIEGLEDIEKKLKKNTSMDDVRRVVRQNGSELHEKMMQNADFKGHYEGKKFKIPTGTTKRSITLDLKDGEMTAEVEPETEYSPYLEYGTRFMEAQPFVRPAFEKQADKFKRDLEKLVR